MRVGRNFCTNPEQMADFETLAERLGSPFSVLIRIAVEKYFQDDLDRIRADKLRSEQATAKREKDAARKREQRQAKKGGA